ncbi:MAG: hypothetical protein H0X66_22335 [Verrucomicrobia bacterium]|nr:hypothetical protein [Verrucomicrobiota bacterium]
MEKDWEVIWKKIGGRAFRMQQKVGDILKKLYGRTANTPDTSEDKADLRTAYNWLIAPFTMWVVDFDGLSRFVFSQVKNDKKIDPQMRFLLSLVKDIPSERAQQIIGDYEHIVQQGAYDQLVREDAKYIAQLKQLLDNPEYHADLAILKQMFDLTKYQTPDSKRILRRTLVSERNMRPGLRFRWRKEKERFQQIFDCFCWKHNLYGLESGDKPLLMKLTVNPTPHGVMIFIPAWMSVDLWRDLLHIKVTELIKARGVLRQGRKYGESRQKTQEMGLRVYIADQECTALNYTGKKRIDYIIEKAGLPPLTGDRQIRKFYNVGEAILKSENAISRADRPPTSDADAVAMNAAKLAQAKAAFAALSADEKVEFMKWQTA